MLQDRGSGGGHTIVDGKGERQHAQFHYIAVPGPNKNKPTQYACMYKKRPRGYCAMARGVGTSKRPKAPRGSTLGTAEGFGAKYQKAKQIFVSQAQMDAASIIC
jgi:glycerate kinase